MALFKDPKKPTIRPAAGRTADISPLRPRFVEKRSPCMDRCPVGVDVRAWLTTLVQAGAPGRPADVATELAWQVIAAANPFPATLGRICPHPCEQGCHREAKDGPVAVNALERAIGDLALARGFAVPRAEATARPIRAAIVGAGPAGLSCAYQLARRRHRVTVFEARDAAGGRLRDGVRTGRIAARVVDEEIARIVNLGVEVRCAVPVPDDLGPLHNDCDVVVVTTGRRQSPLEADDHGRTSRARVYAGGDAVRPGLVGAAIASGRRIAETIESALAGRPVQTDARLPQVPANRLKLDWYPETERAAWTVTVPPDIDDPPVDMTALVAEATRCLSCGSCMDCERCWMFCTNNCVEKLPKGQHFRIKTETCNGCRKCADECVCGYIDMV
ncbi:MAG: FAD-dependent oxidoreductase [Bacteroidales bacterium]